MKGRPIINVLNTIGAIINFFVLFIMLLFLAWLTDSNGIYGGINFIMPSLLSSMGPIMYIFCLFGSLNEEDIDAAAFLAGLPILFPILYIYALFMVS